MLANMPDVLSIGARCLDKGYEIHWAPYSEAPTMTRPNRQVVALRVGDGCTYPDDVDGNEINNVTSVAPPRRVG